MINDDTLIKYFRNPFIISTEDWPERVRNCKKRISECLMGFPGIGLGDISLVPFQHYMLHMRDKPFILDRYLIDEERTTDAAPFLLIENPERRGEWIIEGIGCQGDTLRDPTRMKYRWKNIINEDTIYALLPIGGLGYFPLLVLNGKPTKSKGGAGSVYHYFFRAIRDQRP